MSRLTSARILVILLVVAVALGGFSSGVDATSRRVLLEKEFTGGDYSLESYPSSSVYEQTRLRMAFWLQRLASGPSPRGPGH
uniref:Uncharacterized protein n=1 Tax=Kalanchoe fedtschenkoi TaxID=63787 RepID=A0A7N0U0J5_KALFE